jgi:hypothetical protein
LPYTLFCYNCRVGAGQSSNTATAAFTIEAALCDCTQRLQLKTLKTHVIMTMKKCFRFGFMRATHPALEGVSELSSGSGRKHKTSINYTTTYGEQADEPYAYTNQI